MKKLVTVLFSLSYFISFAQYTDSLVIDLTNDSSRLSNWFHQDGNTFLEIQGLKGEKVRILYLEKGSSSAKHLYTIKGTRYVMRSSKWFNNELLLFDIYLDAQKTTTEVYRINNEGLQSIDTLPFICGEPVFGDSVAYLSGILSNKGEIAYFNLKTGDLKVEKKSDTIQLLKVIGDTLIYLDFKNKSLWAKYLSFADEKISDSSDINNSSTSKRIFSNNHFYFTRKKGRTLWITDGTKSGTKEVFEFKGTYPRIEELYKYNDGIIIRVFQPRINEYFYYKAGMKQPDFLFKKERTYLNPILLKNNKILFIHKDGNWVHDIIVKDSTKIPPNNWKEQYLQRHTYLEGATDYIISHPYLAGVPGDFLFYEVNEKGELAIVHSDTNYTADESKNSSYISGYFTHNNEIYFPVMRWGVKSEVRRFTKENSNGILNEMDCELEIYPNPVSHGLNINNCLDEFLKCEVLSMDGKRIKTFKLKPLESKKVDCSEFKNGLYFVKAQSNLGVRTHKFVVEQ